ncbi:MAG: sugar ABC transporter permease [Spirochaetes bacterium GWD1_61_31]|nr:MAG: sugar ABC transporter permease [Spirochaetes bacterium GWB1_60_80]OHD29077.1 MAG: sugar ABC transporter permease [Spirochaetes bacterium GWC1_61_12]OHD43108.1 MAG: sugar ABC transporter permease [Spirochaetes bacterium GWD1_61_31]OHD44242.1 MAG: sugar ABC transporter permease [Spirochaetes bacterium GWE1_60_18]OHD60398.1 MAG: sugar ABC transporter permease [Spirochaetes bacterium GWF1_60_12]
MNRARDLFTALMAVFLGLVAGAIFMTAIGANPFAGFFYLFRGGLMSISRIGDTLSTATTLILTGLAVAFAFRTGLFNIGVAGQMLVGGLVATMLALTIGESMPKYLFIPLVLVCSMLAGALWAGIAGLLKAAFNVHEVVATIMLNWTAFWVVDYIIPTFFKAGLETESRTILSDASMRMDWMNRLFDGSHVNFGLFVSISAVIIIAIILDKTVLGYELKAVGFNHHAAEYAGIDVARNVTLAMAISGALAGLAGATYYTGYTLNMQIGVMPTAGFDGIAVALLGANSPWGVLAAALFFGILHAGKGLMGANTSIPPEIGDTIIATIIYFAATSILFFKLFDYLKKKFKKGGQA